MRNQIKAGSVIAYLNIFLNMLVSVFLTPFLIRGLGEGEYGVYKIIQSFSGQLAIMSFGISTLVTRNVVFYNTRKELKQKENFLFMARVIAVALAVLTSLVGFVLYFSIDPLYSASLTADELVLAKQLFILLIFNVALSIVCDSFLGLIKAHEKFIIHNGISTLRLVLRLATIVLLVSMGVKSLAIVLTDLAITVLVLIVAVLYGRFGLKERAKFHYFDAAMLKSSFGFSAAVFLQAIVNQVHQSVDNVILGAMQGSTIVTVYSVGLTLYVSFSSLVTVFGSMFGPRATKLVASGANGEELTEFVIKPARIQAMLAALGIAGFVLLGQEFIRLWLGAGYEDVYYITLILIVPVVIPLVESVTNTILDAMLKRMARSLILLAMCAANILLTIVLVKHVGYVGAAWGTAISVIIGEGLLMNVYLHKRIGLNIPKLFKEVFKGTLPCTVATILVGIPLMFLPTGWVGFVAKAVAVCIVFVLLEYFFGMRSDEKRMVSHMLRRFLKKSSQGE